MLYDRRIYRFALSLRAATSDSAARRSLPPRFAPCALRLAPYVLRRAIKFSCPIGKLAALHVALGAEPVTVLDVNSWLPSLAPCALCFVPCVW